MHIAEILSDLTSLRVCGPAEALALVRASSAPSSQGIAIADSTNSAPIASDSANERRTKKSAEIEDPELKKVYDLIRLHELVKMGPATGITSNLEKARKAVDQAVMVIKDPGR